jgi:hypothetical protein
MAEISVSELANTSRLHYVCTQPWRDDWWNNCNGCVLADEAASDRCAFHADSSLNWVVGSDHNFWQRLSEVANVVVSNSGS